MNCFDEAPHQEVIMPAADFAQMCEEIKQLHAECDRLTALLQWEQGHRERIGTHGDECWKWGPAHYECALAEIERLTAMLAPQKPMSAEEVTEPGWYKVKFPGDPWTIVRIGDNDGDYSCCQFIGPIQMPEVYKPEESPTLRAQAIEAENAPSNGWQEDDL